MSKYYDLDKLKELIEAKAKTLIGDGAIAFHAVGKWLDFLPAADVATVQLSIDDVRNLPAVPKQRWIPVSERLPERHKEVIVTDIETSYTYQSQYIGNGYWECDNGILKNRIIAWMPLPEPWKGESE